MKHCILFALLSLSISLNAQVTKVEHFFAGSPKAAELFDLFKNTFLLPGVWDYQTWGDFSSGAITLGNVAFEFVGYEGVDKTTFEGIALEPQQSVEEFITVLDGAQVMHDTIELNTFVMPNGSVAGWSNVTLRNLLPDEAGLFICDYKSREKIFQNRKRASDTLAIINGGPLGIVLLKEIVVGSTDVLLHQKEFAKLPGIKTHRDDLFSFEQGPSIRLVRSSINGIDRIVIRVHSIEKAGGYLKSQGLLGKSSTASIFIDTQMVDGLLIEMTEE